MLRHRCPLVIGISLIGFSLWPMIQERAKAQEIYFDNEHDVPGESIPDSLKSISDLDGDGIRDFVESSLRYNDNRGRAFVRSGATGEAFFAVIGEPAKGFGATSGPVGDVNADGWEDFGGGGDLG